MTSERERHEFLAASAAAVADQRGRLRIVVTLRADFYDRPLASSHVGDLFDRNTIAVTPLSSDELERAIIGPAERVGASVEPALVAAVVHDVSSAPGALPPLVQFALTETFQRRSGSLMTLDAYRELGGVMGRVGSASRRGVRRNNRVRAARSTAPLHSPDHAGRRDRRHPAPGSAFGPAGHRPRRDRDVRNRSSPQLRSRPGDSGADRRGGTRSPDSRVGSATELAR